MICSITSIGEKHLKNHYTSQQIGLNSDKNFSDNFSLQHMLPVIGSDLDFCINKPNWYIILLKVLVMTIQANRGKKVTNTKHLDFIKSATLFMT